MPARGPGTFGWDAVFEYEGLTYAEMDKEQKVSFFWGFPLFLLFHLMRWRHELM